MTIQWRYTRTSAGSEPDPRALWLTTGAGGNHGHLLDSLLQLLTTGVFGSDSFRVRLDLGAATWSWLRRFGQSGATMEPERGVCPAAASFPHFMLLRRSTSTWSALSTRMSPMRGYSRSRMTYVDPAITTANTSMCIQLRNLLPAIP